MIEVLIFINAIVTVGLWCAVIFIGKQLIEAMEEANREDLGLIQPQLYKVYDDDGHCFAYYWSIRSDCDKVMEDIEQHFYNINIHTSQEESNKELEKLQINRVEPFEINTRFGHDS